jgi:hypothetical protein
VHLSLHYINVSILIFFYVIKEGFFIIKKKICIKEKQIKNSHMPNVSNVIVYYYSVKKLKMLRVKFLTIKLLEKKN